MSIEWLKQKLGILLSMFTTSEPEETINPYEITTNYPLSPPKPSRTRVIIGWCLRWMAVTPVIYLSLKTKKTIKYFGRGSVSTIENDVNKTQIPVVQMTTPPLGVKLFDLWICGVVGTDSQTFTHKVNRAWFTEVIEPIRNLGYKKRLKLKFIGGLITEAKLDKIRPLLTTTKYEQHSGEFRKENFLALIFIHNYITHMSLLIKTNFSKMRPSMFLTVLCESIPTDLSDPFVRQMAIQIRKGRKFGVVFKLVFLCRNTSESMEQLRELGDGLNMSYQGEDAELVIIEPPNQTEFIYNFGFRNLLQRAKEGVIVSSLK